MFSGSMDGTALFHINRILNEKFIKRCFIPMEYSISSFLHSMCSLFMFKHSMFLVLLPSVFPVRSPLLRRIKIKFLP